MRDKPDAQATSSSDASPEGRLDSWKEIAAYLSRGIRTVQRWEREEGLPVHRLVHEKRGSIYARKDELAAWWESRRQTLANPIPSEPDRPPTPRLERITRSAATTSWPAISSDARLLAYVSDAGQDGTPPQIWIQQIGGGAMRLTSGEREYSNLSFSPDDTRIVFTAADATGQHVYEIPALGGELRLLKSSASSACWSPDAQWLAYVPLDGSGIRIAARGGLGFRTIGSALVDITCLTWLPDGRCLMVQARPNLEREPDWWVVPVDGSSPDDTGVNRRLREKGTFPLPGTAAWVDDSLVFAGVGAVGVNLYRQRFAARSLQLTGPTEQLTVGNESSSSPAAANGRVVFVSSGVATNLFSLPTDENGLAQGPLRRMTRGPGPIGFLTVTRDFRRLAYFAARIGEGDVLVRDLTTGEEKIAPQGSAGGKGYPAISPTGRQLAYGMRMQDRRPIFIADLDSGSVRTLGEDCNGRPREWIDERFLIIERFGRLNAIAVIDTATAGQHDVLTSKDRSFRNPRLSPNGAWLAFDTMRPGEPPAVMIARFSRDAPIAEPGCILVDQMSSHPFWSTDGRKLYYVPTGANAMIRTAVRAQHVSGESGNPDGNPLAVYSSTEMVMPAFLPGTAPLALPGQILLVLGDFRGDIWMLDLNEGQR
jgi:Tol biopolymer transport system component